MERSDFAASEELNDQQKLLFFEAVARFISALLDVSEKEDDIDQPLMSHN